MRRERHVRDGEVAAEEGLARPALQLVVEAKKVSSRGLVDGRMRFASPHLDDGDRKERGVELGVREVFEEPALRARSRLPRIDGRRGIAVLQVLADDGRVVEVDIPVDERRHFRAGVHVEEVGPVAVAVQRAHALEGDALLVEHDAHLPRVGTEHVVVERQHAPAVPPAAR